MTAGSIAVTPIRVADLLAEDERMPLNVHVIDHPEARILVDTGITRSCIRSSRTWIRG